MPEEPLTLDYCSTISTIIGHLLANLICITLDIGILYFIRGNLDSVQRVVKYHSSYGQKKGAKIDFQCTGE